MIDTEPGAVLNGSDPERLKENPAVAKFVGWIADKRLVDAENGLSGGLHYLWRFLVRWFCPLALLLILLGGIFPDRAAQLFAALGGGEVQSAEVAE